MGRLDDYQQHKVRVWSIYNVDLGRFGALDVTPMWRYNSALTYSLAANSVPLSAVQRARNPGYARLPGIGHQRIADAVLRRARQRRVRRLRPGRSRRDLSGAGVEVAAAVGEARSAQRAQQRQADRRGTRRSRRIPRARSMPTACRPVIVQGRRASARARRPRTIRVRGPGSPAAARSSAQSGLDSKSPGTSTEHKHPALGNSAPEGCRRFDA